MRCCSGQALWVLRGLLPRVCVSPTFVPATFMLATRVCRAWILFRDTREWVTRHAELARKRQEPRSSTPW